MVSAVTHATMVTNSRSFTVPHLNQLYELGDVISVTATYDDAGPNK
jgi:hypothetical protein